MTRGNYKNDIRLDSSVFFEAFNHELLIDGVATAKNDKLFRSPDSLVFFGGGGVLTALVVPGGSDVEFKVTGYVKTL